MKRSRMGNTQAYKLAVLVRHDLKLPKGKLAAQVAHAAVEAALGASPASLDAWRNQGQKKIICKVASEQELLTYVKKARSAKIQVHMIHDAGKTVVEPGTLTCAALGPAPETAIDTITHSLKLL
ncbi:MAG: peptidyl-tRNA hydrolase Pth2 [Candidatus Woesearchaeota archaeon]